MKLFSTILLLLLTGVLTSCEQFLEVLPKDQIVSEAVFDNEATAVATIRGIYSQMMLASSFASGGASSVTMLAGRTSDEFTNMSTSLDAIEFSTNGIQPTNNALRSGLWQDPYKFVYAANLILHNLSTATSLRESTRNQLRGEALFVRAFCHFYLTNMFGDVPIVTSTSYAQNATLPRSSQSSVFAAVIDDLRTAQQLLSDEYVTAERVRPNRAAVTALLARAYLYVGDWANAEAEATKVIQNTAYSLPTDLSAVFRKNSTEAIFQLMPSSAGNNTFEGLLFILIAPPGSSTQVVLNNDLVDAFEGGDLRRSNWVGAFTSGANTWYFPHKYKIRQGTPVDEYNMVLRLAEQYLIRAEARARQNKLPDAIADLDVIRERAGVSLFQDTNPTIDQVDLLLAIAQERRLELFSEWGHRWFDLKRTDRANTVLGSRMGWQTTDQVFPIPQTELNNNPSLAQNPGY